MKYFAAFSLFLLVSYMVGFLKKSNTKASTDFSFMGRNFTTAIKGFAIHTVVWAHTGARLGVGGIQFIAGVGVALFLICSGYGLEMSYQKNNLSDFWKKRFLSVALPFWMVELVGLIFTGQFTWKAYLRDFLFIKPATSYGWFMQYIVICYIIYYLVKRLHLKNEMPLIFATFATWFVIDSLFFANPDMPFLRARQMISFPLGMMIAKYKDRIEHIISRKRVSALIIGGGYNGCSCNGNYTTYYCKRTTVYCIKYAFNIYGTSLCNCSNLFGSIS